MDAQRIGIVSRRTGISIDAIRFYEKAGLLPTPTRTQGGFRLYAEREILDLDFIRRSQQLGFSLVEIRELLSIQRHPFEACTHVKALIEHKLSVVRDKIAELRKVEAGLDAAMRQCRRALNKPRGHGKNCPVLKEIVDGHSRRKRS